jgi:hypothetical protein
MPSRIRKAPACVRHGLAGCRFPSLFVARDRRAKCKQMFFRSAPAALAR